MVVWGARLYRIAYFSELRANVYLQPSAVLGHIKVKLFCYRANIQCVDGLCTI